MRDRDEYEWYFRATFPQVARTVFLVVHDKGWAEDITQEAFLRMLRHWGTVSRYERPEAWVRRVAIRLAVRDLRRESARRGKETLAGGGSTTSPPTGLPDPDVARAIAGLAPMQRAAVVLHYWEDQPVREIAHALQVSESTVKQHLYRARNRLAKSLGEEVGNDVR